MHPCDNDADDYDNDDKDDDDVMMTIISGTAMSVIPHLCCR